MAFTTRPRTLKACIAATALLALAACGGGSSEGTGGTGDGGDGSTAAVRIVGAVEKPGAYGEQELVAAFGKWAFTHTGNYADGSKHELRGPPLISLLRNAGGTGSVDDTFVIATGSSGRRVAYAMAELLFDSSGRYIFVDVHEWVDGTTWIPIAGAEGPFRLTGSDKNFQRDVPNLRQLEVRPFPSAAVAVGGGVSSALTVSGAVNKPARFDLAALQALPASTVVFDSDTYTGVSLWTLLHGTAGLKTDPALRDPTVAMVAVVTGSSGHKELITLGEIDPAHDKLNVLVAYAVNGQPLGADGMARLVVPERYFVTRGVMNLVDIEVQTPPP